MDQNPNSGAIDEASASPTIDGILAHNRAFVERRAYERYATDKYPTRNWPSCRAWTPGSPNSSPRRSG